MYLTIDELKTVLYEYQMDEIAEGDMTVLADGIIAAIEEVRGYLLSANQLRESAKLTKQQYKAWQLYDVDKIFSKEGHERNHFLLRLVKRIAAYNICELAAPDITYQRVQDRYERAVQTLERIAGMTGDPANRLIISGLDIIIEPDNKEEEQAPFRMVSRPKFRHE